MYTVQRNRKGNPLPRNRPTIEIRRREVKEEVRIPLDKNAVTGHRVWWMTLSRPAAQKLHEELGTALDRFNA